MNNGRILISANGNGHSAIATWWFVGVVGAVILAAVFAWMANLCGLPMGVGVIGAVFCLILSGVTHSRIISTAVNVCENTVEGVSVTPKFPLSFILWCSFSSLRLSEFQLQYDQISSVEVENENIIIISTANTQHKIYAMNAREIQKAIMSRKKDIADSNKSKKVDEVKITSETQRPAQEMSDRYSAPTMSFNEELSALESVVNEYETEIKTGKISADGLVNRIHSVGSTDAQLAEEQVVVAVLQSKLDRIQPANLKKIKDQYPDDPQVDKLIRRAADCYLMLSEILCSMSEELVPPDVRSQVHSSNQEVLDGMKEMVDRAINGLPPMTEAVRIWLDMYKFGGLSRLYSDRGSSDYHVLMVAAIGSGQTEVINWLFSARPDMEKNINNIKDEKGESLLHTAAHSGKREIMELLLQRGADINAKDNGGKTILFVLAFHGHTVAMKWLVNELGVPVDTTDNNGWTPMCKAAQVGQVESIECLASLGAKVNADVSPLPLEIAVVYDQVESIKRLKQLGADVKAKNSKGVPPIFFAAMSGQVETLECLIDLGADIEAKGPQGATPMFKAAEAGHVENIECLKRHGANINAALDDGMTPIIVATIGDKLAAIERLADLGAEVNVSFQNGVTPIFVALQNNNIESVKCLVKKGADLNQKHGNGMTPLDGAIEFERTEIAEYLRNNGAKRATEL